MHKYNIIALVGESGSGKDTVLRQVLKEDRSKLFHQKISYTSRPKRDYEVDGEDYYFIEESDFTEHYEDFFEFTNFNGWYYGTKYSDLEHEKVNIGIFDMHGLKTLLKNPRINCLPIYIKTNDKTRLIRNLKREKNPNIEEIFRRYLADKNDFKEIKKYVKIIVENNEIDNLQEISHKILQIGHRIRTIQQENQRDADYQNLF